MKKNIQLSKKLTILAIQYQVSGNFPAPGKRNAGTFFKKKSNNFWYLIN